MLIKGLKKNSTKTHFVPLIIFGLTPYSLEFAGFHLLDGEYQPLSANSQGHLWSQQLGLYLGVHNNQLRFFTPQGQLVSTLEETAEELAIKAEQSVAQAERFAAKLRELDIDPETI